MGTDVPTACVREANSQRRNAPRWAPWHRMQGQALPGDPAEGSAQTHVLLRSQEKSSKVVKRESILSINFFFFQIIYL